MKRIAVITGTRADYGLLYWVIKGLHESHDFQLQLLVCGAHLQAQFGKTRTEIENDGFPIARTVEFSCDTREPAAMSRSTGEAVVGFSQVFSELDPQMLVVLGDRFEAFAATQAAMLMNIPIAHLHGGELTEGAVDDCLRHAMTKLSQIHFVAADEYRRRVIQLGEQPERVFNVGATGLESLLKEPLMTETDLLDSLPIEKLGSPFFLITFHPETNAADGSGSVEPLLSVLDGYPNALLLITAPNLDRGGDALLERLKQFSQQRSNAVFVESLGRRRYLSCLSLVDCVIGNSSSGLIEVPSFGKPTVNIGDRQKGRLSADSVLHVANDLEAISSGVETALSEDFAEICRGVVNPYGQGNTSERILEVLRALDWTLFDRGKAFYDVSFDCPPDEEY